MTNTKPFLWFLFSATANVVLSDDCRTVQFEPQIEDRFLKNQLLRSMKLPSRSKCELRCYQEADCVSYNFGPTQSDAPSCDLNNSTHLQVPSSDFVTKDGYIYRYILNSCQSSPCSVNFICQAGFTEKGYRCLCESDFISGSGSLFGSCYKLFTVPETWDNALAKCEGLGAQLVKIESAEENDFIKSTFLNISGVTFWIGLSDQVQEGQWIWSDNSSLGDYVDWFQDPNNLGGNQHCVHIVKGPFSIGEYYFRDYHFGWNDLECNITLGYICEVFSP